MLTFFKRLLCAHEFKFLRNIHGDEIITWGYKRSLWKCTRCAKVEARDGLSGDGV